MIAFAQKTKQTLAGLFCFLVELMHPNANIFVFIGGFGVAVSLKIFQKTLSTIKGFHCNI